MNELEQCIEKLEFTNEFYKPDNRIRKIIEFGDKLYYYKQTFARILVDYHNESKIELNEYQKSDSADVMYVLQEVTDNGTETLLVLEPTEWLLINRTTNL